MAEYETRKIYLFRHTESIDNAHQVFSGDRDYGLSENGKRGAYELAKELKDKEIGIFFTSPLKRCRECLDLVINGYHPEANVIIDERLIERDYGWLEGHQKYDTPFYIRVVKLFSYRSWYVSPPGGENFHQVWDRVMPFVEYMKEVVRKDKVNVAICGHNNSMKPIRAYLEGIPPKKALDLNTQHEKIYEYEIII